MILTSVKNSFSDNEENEDDNFKKGYKYEKQKKKNKTSKQRVFGCNN